MPRLRFVIAVMTAAVVALAACGDPDPTLGGRAALGVVDGAPGATPSTTIAEFVDTDVSVLSTTTVAPGPADSGLAVVPLGGALLSTEPDGAPFIQIHENVVMPFANRSGDWLEVATMCGDMAWVQESAVEVTPTADSGETPGPGFDLTRAVVVVDPGHGDRDWGAVGPSGVAEKHVNLDIAERVRSLMDASNDVDWATGSITPGSAVPAFGTVWLTRPRSGPNEGEYEMGLAFRAAFANGAGADVLVSIHNNSVPRLDTDIPGTEVYYQMNVPDSDRLAALIYEELLRSFSGFSAPWTGGEVLGARTRFDPETNDDYYGLLRRATMPAAIVEGLYLDQPEQEALLDTEEFRQAYADGVYRGVVRFLTTNETFDAINPPEPFPDDVAATSTSGCVLPEQS